MNEEWVQLRLSQSFILALILLFDFKITLFTHWILRFIGLLDIMYIINGYNSVNHQCLFNITLISNEMWFFYNSYALSKRTLHGKSKRTLILQCMGVWDWHRVTVLILVNIYGLLRNTKWVSYVMYLITKETLFSISLRDI